MNIARKIAAVKLWYVWNLWLVPSLAALLSFQLAEKAIVKSLQPRSINQNPGDTMYILYSKIQKRQWMIFASCGHLALITEND